MWWYRKSCVIFIQSWLSLCHMQNAEGAVHKMSFQHIRPELVSHTSSCFHDRNDWKTWGVREITRNEIETHKKASIVNWREILKTVKIFPNKHFKLLVIPDNLSIYWTETELMEAKVLKLLNDLTLSQSVTSGITTGLPRGPQFENLQSANLCTLSSPTISPPVTLLCVTCCDPKNITKTTGVRSNETCFSKHYKNL